MNTNRATEVGAGKTDDTDRIFLMERGTPCVLLCSQKAKLQLQLDRAQGVRVGSSDGGWSSPRRGLFPKETGQGRSQTFCSSVPSRKGHRLGSYGRIVYECLVTPRRIGQTILSGLWGPWHLKVNIIINESEFTKETHDKCTGSGKPQKLWP